ncbi:MAG TPA: hypothetical protein DDY13_16630 [Cytophagales bacterium]|nr:hypothetical protein [Cytophagales bacterium]
MVRKFNYRRNGPGIPVQNIVTGILLWALYNYILYAFFYFTRETFRIFSGDTGRKILLTLNETEVFLSNLFLSALASSIGFLVSLRFVLTMYAFENKRLVRHPINELNFYLWSLLLWFGTLGALLGLLYMILPIQFDLDFQKEFPIFLILLPIVVFMSPYPKMVSLLGSKRKLFWSLSFLIFMVFSVSFAFKDFVDYNKVNKNYHDNQIENLYNLQVPVSRYHKQIPANAIAEDIYMVLDSVELKPILFVNNRWQSFHLKEVFNELVDLDAKLSEHEQILLNLHIDRSMIMSHVQELRHEIRKAGHYRIWYSTGRKHSRYSAQNPIFKYCGIPQQLPAYDPWMKYFIDSVASLNPESYKLKLPKSNLYRIDDIKLINRIEIEINTETTKVNNQLVNTKDLRDIIYKLVKKYHNRYAIILNVDGAISFGRYIEILDLVHSEIQKLRNSEKTWLNQNTTKSPSEIEELINHTYPINVIEWTYEEINLIELNK